MVGTVCVTPREGVSGSTLYEVQNVDGTLPRYRVFGHAEAGATEYEQARSFEETFFDIYECKITPSCSLY